MQLTLTYKRADVFAGAFADFDGKSTIGRNLKYLAITVRI